MNRILLSVFSSLLMTTPVAFAELLITDHESSLPNQMSITTRGITRGPGIKLISPQPEEQVKAPFLFKVAFEPRGGEKIDPNSVKVTYLKSPAVDLTSRLKDRISPNGIELSKAEIPAGVHAIKVSVKDLEGRETNTVFNLTVHP